MDEQRKRREIERVGEQPRPQPPPIRVEIPAPRREIPPPVPRQREIQPRPIYPRDDYRPPADDLGIDAIQQAYGANGKRGPFDPLLVARVVGVLAWLGLAIVPLALFGGIYSLTLMGTAVLGLLLAVVTIALHGFATRPGTVLAVSILGLILNGMLSLLFACGLFFSSLFNSLFGWMGRH